MDVVALTRQLVDIESITGNEALVGEALHGELCRLGYQAVKMPVEGNRFNVYATSTQQLKPDIVFSTHMDLRQGIVRCQRNHRGSDRGCRTVA